MLRQVIVTMMGNVDSGKSQTIDTIKKTSIIKSEPGKITQTIKAYNISLEVIRKVCGKLVDVSKLKIPGMLLLDTPGHASFSNLRKRGGSLADIAVLIVDINEGIKPQTEECIAILKESKTPFIIALNKIDLFPGWVSDPSKSLLENMNSQSSDFIQRFETKFYELVGTFHEKGFNIERFDRVNDYSKVIASVPISAKSGEGLAELVMVLVGLAQRFLESCLECEVSGAAKGTVLEVLEEKGLGKTLDTIIYDGVIKKGDQVVLGSLKEPIITKVKALFIPEGKKLKSLDEAHAAMGVKIACQESEGVISGMPVQVVSGNLDKVIFEIKEQIKETTFELDEEGVVVKADSIGSMEAAIASLRERKVAVKRASVGLITKKDLVEAEANRKPINRIVLGFRISEVEAEAVKVIAHDVIYTLLDDVEIWRKKKQLEVDAELLKGIIKPCKIRILPGCIFRQNNPAVVGVEIISGVLKPGASLMKEDLIMGAKSVELDGKSVSEAKEGKQVAVSIPGVNAGRQIKEGDILYSSYSEDEFRRLKKLKKFLNGEEVQLLKEIAEIKRKINPVWGIG